MKKSNILILISFVVGILSGISQNKVPLDTAEVISTMLINAFKFISMPILFLAIMSTICSISNISDYKSISKKTLKYSVFTTVVSSFVALGIFLIIQPDMVVDINSLVVEENNEGVKHHLINIIPSNIVELFLSGNIISIVIFSFIFGLASLKLDINHRNYLQDFFSSFFHLMMQIASGVIKLVPLIIWSSTALITRDYVQGYSFDGLLLYIATISIANFVQAVLILPLLLVVKGINPLVLFKHMSSALITAFFTKSSMVSLPEAIRCATENAKIDSRVTKFTMPLCITVNMNACAAFILITVLTISTSYGTTFTSIELVMWALMASIAAFGNAGVPMGCYFMASAFLTSMQIPLYYMGVILPFYLVLDMFETAVNVWSNSCITSIIGRKEHTFAQDRD